MDSPELGRRVRLRATVCQWHHDGNPGGLLIQRIPTNLLGRYPEPDRIGKDSV